MNGADDYLTALDVSDYLEHYGTVGMKWGVRKYQKKDGSLTSAGRKRYYTNDGELTSAGEKRFNRIDDYKRNKSGKPASKRTIKKVQNYLDNFERDSIYVRNAGKQMPKKELNKMLKKTDANIQKQREYHKLYSEALKKGDNKTADKYYNKKMALSKENGKMFTQAIKDYPATVFTSTRTRVYNKDHSKLLSDTEKISYFKEPYSKVPVHRDAKGRIDYSKTDIKKMPGRDDMRKKKNKYVYTETDWW